MLTQRLTRVPRRGNQVRTTSFTRRSPRRRRIPWAGQSRPIHLSPPAPIVDGPGPELAAMRDALTSAHLLCLGRRPMVSLPRVSR